MQLEGRSKSHLAVLTGSSENGTDAKSNNSQQHSMMQLPMGDGRKSPVQWIYITTSPSSTANAGANDDCAIRFTHDSRRKKQRSRELLVKILCCLVVVSWLAASRTLMVSRSLLKQLDDQDKSLNIQLTQASDGIKKAKREKGQAQRYVNKLKKTKRALQHEFRVLQEMSEEGMEPQTPSLLMDEGFIAGWMQQREYGLHKRLEGLQGYLQDLGRKEVLEKYGPGPHRVRIMVEFIDHRKKSVFRSFVVELGSLSQVPHSTNFFLDMVTAKIWDNSIFLHHEHIQHVIAAAPMDYNSKEIRFSQLNKIGWDTLGFLEYSDDLPHKQYTIGFAHRGPTFFINTMDNSASHGPGGQLHHYLPGEGEPCFARVVEGRDVVDTLVRFGAVHNKLDPDGLHPWADNEHSWTRIVKAEIVD